MVPWPTQVLNPNGISIRSLVFAGLTSVTDRQTTLLGRSVTVGRIYVHSTVMWPSNMAVATFEAPIEAAASVVFTTLASVKDNYFDQLNFKYESHESRL